MATLVSSTGASGAPARGARNWGLLAVSLVLCQLAGIVGTLGNESGSSPWFEALRKPAFQPPDWVFAPVWISLYTMMGISLWLVWRQGASDPLRRTSLIIFFVQLALNTAWSQVFFGLHNPPLALAVIALLWAFILTTILRFFVHSRPAALLLIPYLAWVTFAAILNIAIVTLNR